MSSQINSSQISALDLYPDADISLMDARALLKSAKTPERKRTVPNVFTSLSGRAQPRQGFLSTDVLRAVYLRSELIRACVDTLVELVAAVPWMIRPSDEDKTAWLKKRKPEQYLDQQKRIQWLKEFFRQPNNYEDFDTFTRRLLRDLLIFDAAAYEIVTAQYPEGDVLPLELGAIAGDTIEVECNLHGIPTAYWQSYNVIHNVAYEWEEIAYMSLNPCSWQPYGLSPIETAYISIAADLNALNYNNSYFAKNGIPPALLAVIGVSDSQFKGIMSQMRQTSNDNNFNIHAFRANQNPDGSAQKVFEMVPLSQVTNKDMQFHELMQTCINRITMAYRLSPSMIGFTEQVTGGIGSGVAETQEDLMQNKAVGPLLRKLAATHTQNVIWATCGWEDLEFAYTQSNTPQDQQDYSRSLQEVQQGIKTINEHRSQFGGRKAVDWGGLPSAPPPGWQPPQSPEQMQQQAMQQMGGGAPPGGQPPGAPPVAPPPAPMGKSANKKITITF